jgi:hypothetical protein
MSSNLISVSNLGSELAQEPETEKEECSLDFEPVGSYYRRKRQHCSIYGYDVWRNI